MKFSVKMIAATACAVLLMPVYHVFASEAAKPSSDAKNNKRVDSLPVVGADPAASLPSAPMAAASMDKATPDSRGPSYTPRVEWFVGYSYLRAVPEFAAGNRMVYLNGGSTSIAFNFNRYFGLVGDFGGFGDTTLMLTDPNENPSTLVNPKHNSSGTVYTYLFGPRLSFRKFDRVTPFAQALFGGIHAGAVSPSDCTGVCPGLPVENSFAFTAGGGLDVKVNHHFAIRVIQAEYMMTRFDNFTTGATAGQNDIRLSAGLVFRFGGKSGPPTPPPPPLTYSCSLNPSSVFAGESIGVSCSAQNLNPAKTPVYTWAVNGGTVTGTSSTASIDTRNLAPGSYALKAHVSEGDNPNENADGTAPYTVKAIEPPTVSCSANPSRVNSGDSSTITATGVSPQNRSLTYSYSASSGSINGSGATAALATSGVSPGPIRVTCTVVDDKAQTASSTTEVMVAVPTAPLPAVSELCSVNFSRDGRRPSRVDNEGKACLDQVALSLQKSPDARLALVGNAAGSEKNRSQLGGQRAANTRAYLVSDKGIDSSRITVYTGSQDGKTVSTILVPAGANFEAAGDKPMH
jgi:opacity protein-like surface antigen/outer membrane protein OmpA-like peptidoglycan-associated protein